MASRKRKKHLKGLTFTELILVIALIGIMASVITVNLFEARKRAAATSILQSMTSVAPIAFKCLLKSESGIRLNEASSGTNVCSDAEGMGNWPNISSTSWDYSGNFFWCNVNSTGSSNPASCAYADGSCGGTSKYYTTQISGSKVNLCYGMAFDSNTRFVWCTADGCQKKGF